MTNYSYEVFEQLKTANSKQDILTAMANLSFRGLKQIRDEEVINTSKSLKKAELTEKIAKVLWSRFEKMNDEGYFLIQCWGGIPGETRTALTQGRAEYLKSQPQPARPETTHHTTTKLEKCPDDFICKENDTVCNRNIDFIETCGEDYELIHSILNTANKYTIFYMWNILYGRILDIRGYSFSDITRYAPEDTPREYHKEAIIRGYIDLMKYYKREIAVTDEINRKHEEYKKTDELEKSQSQPAPSQQEVIDVEARDITETTQPEELPELKAIHGGMNLEILQQDIEAKEHNKRIFASINTPEIMDAVLKNAHSTAIVQFHILAGMSELHASNIPDYYLAAKVVNHLYPDYKPAQDILRAPFLEDPSRYSLRKYRKEHENYSFYKDTKKWLNECRRKNSSIIMQCQSYDDIKIMLIHISVEGILLQAQYDHLNLGKSLIRDTEETRNDYANAYIMKLKARREKKSKQTTPTTQPAITAPALPAHVEDKPTPAPKPRNSKPAKPLLTLEAIDKCTSHEEIVAFLSNFKKSEISSFMASIGIYLGVMGTAKLPCKLPKLISYCAAKILQKRNVPQQPTMPSTPKSKIYYTTPAPAVKADKHGQLMFVFEEEVQCTQHEVITPSKKRAPAPARRGKKRSHRHSVKVKAL